MRSIALAAVMPVLAFTVTPAVHADVWGKAAQEAVELLVKKFGKEVAEEGLEKLTGRIASAAARHGDDVIGAVRKVGPKALGLADDAGEHAPQVMRLLARHGDDAARVLGTSQGMALFARYGDEAAEIMMKHKGIAGPVLEAAGQPAIKALSSLGPQNGRRLAMLASGGHLASIGRTDELLSLIASRGDRACDFIYRNRAVLAGTAALTAFLANPEPYLDGTKQLAQIAVDGATGLTGTVAENAIRPAVTAVGGAARDAMGFAFKALAVIAIAALIGIAWAVKSGVHNNSAVKATAKVAWNRATAYLAARKQQRTGIRT